jgi:hypothetical protein
MIDETFSVEQGQLVRRVVPRRGRPYEHRCTPETFQEVAHRIDELRGSAFVLADLNRAGEALPWTQVAVALAFLKERGCVRPVYGRRHEAASGDVYLDAMVEFHALREKPTTN